MLPISIANAGRYKKQHAPVYLIFGFNLCNCFEALLLMEMKITFGCTSCICSTRVQHVPAVTSQWRLLLPISQLNFLASCSAVYKVINMNTGLGHECLVCWDHGCNRTSFLKSPSYFWHFVWKKLWVLRSLIYLFWPSTSPHNIFTYGVLLKMPTSIQETLANKDF